MKKQLFTLLTLLVLFATGAWADDAYGFENNKTSESGYPTSAGDGSRSISSTVYRTGSYSLEQNNKSTNDKTARVEGLAATFQGNNHYVHYIAYIKKTTSNTVTLKEHGLYQGSDFAKSSPNSALSTDWTRITGYGQRTGNTTNYTNVQFRVKSNTATSGDKVYIDDIVVYVTATNVPTDLTAPSSATAASATVAAISWTNGSDTGDGATGIQKTLIFRRTSGSANDLTLNNQGIYSLTAKEGPSTDQSGHWTLVTASVAADATSYSGAFTSGDVYAIVHRDLAYNYSAPTYVTIPASSGHTISFNANGGTGTMVSIVDIEDDGSETLPSNTFTKTGYTFANWTADVNVTIGGSTVDAGDPIADEATITNINSDIALTAQWNAIDYDITHSDASNGTYTIKVGDASAVSTNTTANYGQTITLAATPDDGYALSAWNVSETVSGDPVAVTENAFTMPAADVTIAPTFAQVYTVTYNGNGNENGSAPVDANSPYTSGSNVTVLGNTGSLTKTDYVFIGWNTAADGSGTSYAPGDKFSISANTTLYAQWGISLTWNVQVNKAETTVTTTSTASSKTSYIANPSNLALTDLTVESSSKTTATNKISTTKEKGGYISATFAVQNGYKFTPTRMSLKTTAITEAKTIEVNVGDEVQTWAQPKSGADPDEHNYAFASAKAYTGTVTMKIYAYGGSDGTKGYRLGTPIVLYGKVEAIPEPSDPTVEGSTVTLTTTANMAGWRTYNNNTANKYSVDANTKVYYASAAAGSKVTLTEIDGGVPANTIVILHKSVAKGDGTYEITLTETDASITAPGSNKLTVTEGASTDLSGGVYRLGYKTSDGVGFYKYSSATAPAGIIYLTLDSPANFLGLDLDETTGLNEIKGQKAEVQGKYYNLNGQKVAKPTKGLYIVNGKKVVVR